MSFNLLNLPDLTSYRYLQRTPALTTGDRVRIGPLTFRHSGGMTEGRPQLTLAGGAEVCNQETSSMYAGWLITEPMIKSCP